MTGVRNTVNRIFHLVSMEVRYTLDHYELYNQLIVPRRNIATIADSGVVWEGVSRTRNTLINGDYKNYDWDSGYTCHQLGSGYICIQLAQPYFVSSMRLVFLFIFPTNIFIKWHNSFVKLHFFGHTNTENN